MIGSYKEKSSSSLKSKKFEIITRINIQWQRTLEHYLQKNDEKIQQIFNERDERLKKILNDSLNEREEKWKKTVNDSMKELDENLKKKL